MMQLQQCLMETGTSLLRAIASYRKCSLGPNPSRAASITELSQSLNQEAQFKEVINRLSSWEYEILHQLRNADGAIDAAQLQTSWGNDDLELDKRWFWHETVNRGLPGLRLAGIIFLGRSNETGKQVYTFPKEYMVWFPSPDFQKSGDDYTPYSYWSPELLILSDIYQSAQYFQGVRVRPLQNGSIPKRHKRQILKRFEEMAPSQDRRNLAYLEMIISLMFKIGFLHILNGQIAVAEAFEIWFEKSQVGQIRDLYQVWLKLGDQINLELVCGMTVVSAGLRHPPDRVKNAVTELIKTLPDQWISLSDISRHFQRIRPFFYRPDHSPGLWRLVNKKTGEPVASHAIWNCLEYRILEHIIVDCLAWLGLVDVGFAADGRNEGLHITKLGFAVFQGIEDFNCDGSRAQLNKIIIQPDFAVLAPAGMVLSVRDRLERVAEFISGGHMQCYKLSRDSVARAMETGMNPEEIILFLESAARDGLPENVKRSVLDWINEFGKIEFSRKLVMMTDDEFLMQEVLSRPVTNRLIQKQIGPSAALVDEGDLETLISEMKRVGFLPRIQGITNGKGNLVPISLGMDIRDVDYLREYLKLQIIERENEMSDTDKVNLKKIVTKLESSLNGE